MEYSFTQDVVLKKILQLLEQCTKVFTDEMIPNDTDLRYLGLRLSLQYFYMGVVPWTARRSNQSILKEISPGFSLEGLILKLKLQ